MLVILGLLFLQVSFCLHIYFLIQYVLKRLPRYLTLFTATLLTNMIISLILIIVLLNWPKLAQSVDVKFLTWLMAGVFMIMMFFIKIGLVKKIRRKCKDPSNFHYNFFGKKVLHAKVVEKYELFIFLFTIPVFLFAGSYFVARLINLILYSHI